jgi:hypothetical protein
MLGLGLSQEAEAFSKKHLPASLKPKFTFSE